jgi:citrate lyase subunit beta/citryl-CoA lyase
VKAVDARAEKIRRAAGLGSPCFLMPIIESALGCFNALAIATASPNVVALTIGLEDYTADLGAERTREGRESLWARQVVVNAARAAGVTPIDTVFSDLSDMEGLRQSILEAKALGFEGKGCIHPRQIPVVHEAFAPSAEELEKAKRIVLAFEDAQGKGLGVVAFGSKMIDPPVVKRALRTVQMAETLTLLPTEWRSQAETPSAKRQERREEDG